MRKIIKDANVNSGKIASENTSMILQLGGAHEVSIQCIYTDDTPDADTFIAGEAETGTITFDTKANTSGGDYVVIYDTSGSPWAVAADTTGSDEEPTGDIWAAIPAAQKTQADISGDTTAADVAATFETAFDNLTNVPFSTDDSDADGTLDYELSSIGDADAAIVKNSDDSGAGSISVSVTNDGVDSAVNISDDQITLASHGFVTGLKGQLTSTGTLPAGLSTSTDYFVIVVDSNTISLASSLQNALSGTAIDITDEGTDGATHTFTPTSLSNASVTPQKSNDRSNWTDIAAATDITGDGSSWFEYSDPGYKYLRLKFELDSGQLDIDNHVVIHGNKT